MNQCVSFFYFYYMCLSPTYKIWKSYKWLELIKKFRLNWIALKTELILKKLLL